MFRHVKPMRSNVGHTTRRTTGGGVDAPIPIRVIQQPVLGISTLHDENLSQIPRLAQATHLLHHGVVAQIVTNAVAYALPGGNRGQFFCFRHGCGQRLLADHVLTRQESVFGHREMLGIGRTDVDRIDRGVAKHIAIVVRQ